jgi:hypothetical protein
MPSEATPVRSATLFLVGAYYAITGAGVAVLAALGAWKRWPEPLVLVCAALAAVCTAAVVLYVLWAVRTLRRCETLAWAADKRTVLKAAAAPTHRTVLRFDWTQGAGYQRTERQEPIQ